MPSAIPCSLSSLISRIQPFLFSDWRQTVSSKFFATQAPSFSTEELVLPRHARCVLSRLSCNGHSLLSSSYLFRIGRNENPSCSACGHPSQDTSHLILHCPTTDSLRRLLLGDSLSLYNLWSRPWRVARLLGPILNNMVRYQRIITPITYLCIMEKPFTLLKYLQMSRLDFINAFNLVEAITIDIKLILNSFHNGRNQT